MIPSGNAVDSHVVGSVSPSNLTDVNPLDANAFVPILVTVDGNVIVVNVEHPLNTSFPIVSTFGNVTVLTDEHPLNAFACISVTDGNSIVEI